MSERLLKVSEVAQRVGVLPSTIRYYAKLQLIRARASSRGGFQLFDDGAVVRAVEIKRLQKEERLTLEEIGERLGAPR